LLRSVCCIATTVECAAGLVCLRAVVVSPKKSFILSGCHVPEDGLIGDELRRSQPSPQRYHPSVHLSGSVLPGVFPERGLSPSQRCVFPHSATTVPYPCVHRQNCPYLYVYF
ncbi:hypothetical protein OESDEN_18333, partial [Oesophagostomum dentatum]